MNTLLCQFPMSVTIAGQKLLLHNVFETISVFVAFRYYLYLKKQQGDILESTQRVIVIIGALFGSLMGARILGVCENLPEFFSTQNKIQYFLYNKTLVGGLIGGLIGVEIVKKIISEKNSTGDLFVFPLLLAMIIGRIGCFSAGIAEQTYGLESHLPWAMNLGDGLLRHPVALYEIAFLLLLWMFLQKIKVRFILANGAVFKLFLIFYVLFRFVLDFIKPGWRYFVGLGSIQICCLLGLLYYIRYIINPQLLLQKEKNYNAS